MKKPPKQRDIPNSREISAFMHCALCIQEKPAYISPRDYAQIECGWTVLGFQVWCKRHEVNIMHVDFEGMKHPANMTRNETANVEKRAAITALRERRRASRDKQHIDNASLPAGSPMYFYCKTCGADLVVPEGYITRPHQCLECLDLEEKGWMIP